MAYLTRSHRSHRSSRKSDAGSSVSKHSSSSKHSKSSKHSHHSHHSKRSHRSSRQGEHEGSPLSREWHDVEEYPSVIRPSVISEPSDASTIKPLKSRSGRKDSVNGVQYEAMFNNVSYGSGTVASLPIRGLTPSMIDDSRDGKKGNRSVISYAMGQKLRPFEG